MSRARGRAAFLFLLALLTLASCGRAREERPLPSRTRGPGPLHALCTTTVVADLVRRIGGEDVAVDVLMGPGVDPHAYRISRADRRRLEAADIIFAGGLGLEAHAAKELEAAARSRPVIALGDSIHPTLLIARPDDASELDPHIWLDPQLWMRAAAIARIALQHADSTHAMAYKKRSDVVAGSLNRTTQWIGAELDSVAVERRILAATHEGLGYLARVYGWQWISPASARASFTGGSHPDPLAELIAARRVPALFVTTSDSPGAASRIAGEVKERGRDVRVIPGLYLDEFDSPGTAAGTWEGAMRANVQAILAALR